MIRSLICVFAMLFLLGAAPATQPLPRIVVMQSDFSDAEFRFETAYAAHRPDDPAQRATIHQAFDQALVHQLNGRLAQAIEIINGLAESLEPAAGDRRVAALVHSLQVRIAPAVGWRTRPGVMHIRIARMYHADSPLPQELHLVIRPNETNSQPVLDVPVPIADDVTPFSLIRAGPRAAAGQYVVELIAADGTRYPVGRWSVVDQPLNVSRAGNDRQLRGVVSANDAIRFALIAAINRNALLTEKPDENLPAQYLPDPIRLSSEIASEVQAIAKEKNPYANRVGDWWCAIPAGTAQIPARIYGPPQSAQKDPLPLIIVLQGAGHDESGFMESCGRGRIKQLADKNGFVVAAPNSIWLTNNPAAFDSIVSSMSLLYPIDRSRIYIIAQSGGTISALRMATRNSDRIAGMVLISGGDLTDINKLPRTRLYNGLLDPFFLPREAKTIAEQAQRNHLPLELHSVPDSGHALLADDVLDEAVKWLISP